MADTILIIPAYNEAERLPAVLESVKAAGLGCETVVVNDGSIDETERVARDHGAIVVGHPFNLGYGAALQTGYKYALRTPARYVVQMDADGQHRPGELQRLLAPIIADELDLVIGSRFLEDSGGYEMGVVRSVGRRLFTVIARLAGLQVSDPTSGFQAMNRRVLEMYTADFFPTDYPDVDVLLAAKRHGLRVGERPVQMEASVRASTMHGGLRSVYYVYKMLLSTFSATTARRPR